ncbi:MAG: DNA methyltransferase [Thermomicrobiales bacterium]
MVTKLAPGRLDHLTFKGNLKHTRYGWLRLTPAYSVHLVSDLLEECASPDAVVLDPFCGTGTTALVCAEQGIACDTTDINPFLLWLTEVKSRSYTAQELEALTGASLCVADAMRNGRDHSSWFPSLHQIEKWWDEKTLAALGHAMAEIKEIEQSAPEATADLLKVAFCRVMIERANVSFGHQSMSFKKIAAHTSSLYSAETLALESWEHAVNTIADAASSEIRVKPRAIYCDARNLSTALDNDCYTCVITSPPYPNRMSYIRELRPYMYWLGYLRDGREAGELDWQAIGGTWGVATSNAGKWTPEDNRKIQFTGFDDILEDIARHSHLLSRYVHKYFYDMVSHCNELFRVVKPGGTIHYIVGNSKFYDVMLPVESIFTSLFEAAGFEQADVRVIRKRTSKKELFEYVVSARKPEQE